MGDGGATHADGGSRPRARLTILSLAEPAGKGRRARARVGGCGCGDLGREQEKGGQATARWCGEGHEDGGVGEGGATWGWWRAEVRCAFFFFLAFFFSCAKWSAGGAVSLDRMTDGFHVIVDLKDYGIRDKLVLLY